MHESLPRLGVGAFPPIRRNAMDALQINIGYRCNQSCVHCHVSAGPKRTEAMSRETIDLVLDVLRLGRIKTLDITGGAPEMHPGFRHLVREARRLDVHVMDRCNLTILCEPGYEDMAGFLADHGVEVVASLPCYLGENVDRQRGKGVFDASIEGLRQLNRLGYGTGQRSLTLSLVYNPQGPVLPPPQTALQAAYEEELGSRFGIRFDRLLTITNMPIGRFGSTLVSKGQFDGYVSTLKAAYEPDNLNSVMCRTLVSVDWQGYLYDCDFNQMLGLPMRYNGQPRTHLRDLLDTSIDGNPIVVRDHCFACTAGKGSSCGGALS
jgi:radical SAM/Cys-rich protein